MVQTKEQFEQLAREIIGQIGQRSDGAAQDGELTNQIQGGEFDYQPYRQEIRENLFKNTSLQEYVIGGKIPMMNLDMQAFAEDTELFSGVIPSNDHDLEVIKLVQYFCAREILVSGGKDYVKAIKAFPKMEQVMELKAELQKVKTQCEDSTNKTVFPIRYITNVFRANQSLFCQGDNVIIMVPNNIAFINGVINTLAKNCTKYMKLVCTACKQIRQGKKPADELIEEIRTHQDKSFKIMVITSQIEENAQSKRIKNYVIDGGDEGLIGEMLQIRARSIR